MCSLDRCFIAAMHTGLCTYMLLLYGSPVNLHGHKAGNFYACVGSHKLNPDGLIRAETNHCVGSPIKPQWT